MNNLYWLLKVYALNIFGVNKAIHSGNKREKIKLTSFSVLMFFVIIMLAFTSFMYSMVMSDSLEQANAMRTLPAIMMAAASLITLFTTIYKTNGILFGFRDYEIVMALPFKTGTIVASRLLMLYGMNLFFILFVMVPAAVVYGIRVHPSFAFYVIFIITLFMVPLIPIVFATFIGLLISAAAARFRHSNAVAVIFTMLLFIALMLISFNMQTIITDFANISTVIMTSVNRVYPLTELYTQAVCDYRVSSLLLFCGLSIGVFGTYVFFVGRSFKRLNAILTARHTASNYKITSLKVSSPFMALYRKEIKRYFSSSLYVMNTAAGAVMLTLASVALLFTGSAQLESFLEIPELSKFLNDLAPLAVSLFIALSCTSACSISLEGKNLWIIKSLPVDPMIIFMSKAAVNMVILVPAVIVNSAIFAFALHTSALQTLFLFLTPIIYAGFISLAGLIINLMFPNFTWESETVVIKQSMAVILVLLAGMVAIAIPFVLIFALSFPAFAVTAWATLAFAILDFSLYLFLKHWGVNKFAAL